MPLSITVVAVVTPVGVAKVVVVVVHPVVVVVTLVGVAEVVVVVVRLVVEVVDLEAIVPTATRCVDKLGGTARISLNQPCVVITFKSLWVLCVTSRGALGAL